MSNVYMFSLGSCEEVTGSKHILEINGVQYMIDCGMWQGNSYADKKNREFTFPVDKLQSIFLTHAHADHCCLLPKLVKDGYKGKIYSTPATRDLASIVMLDSARIQQYEKGGAYYEEKDCIETMNHFRCSVYGKEKKLNDNFKFTFYDAGHILGSSMLDISIPKYTNFFSKLIHKKSENRMHILFSGDLGRKNNPICKPPETDIPAPDYIYLESTYGAKIHESIDTVYQELAYVINRTIERGGKVIIPSFAVERAQELIYFIKVLMKQEKVPRVPVYIDSPMASNATGVFNIHPECFNNTIKNEFLSKGKNPFSVRTLKFISDFEESQKIAKSKKPAIVIAANGMCEAGRIINHLKYGVENPNNTILIVGYMSENTLGRKILNKEEKLIIDKKELTLKAEVQKINAFSAHADYKEMLEWLQTIDTSKLKKIFLVHGEKEAQKHFSEYLKSNGFKNVQIVKEGEVYKL